MVHSFDLTNLSEQELIGLNRDIVERIKFLRQKESYEAMAKFNIGDRVSFETNTRLIQGTIARLNKKTATIHADDHQHWNVSPHVLKKNTMTPTTENHNRTTVNNVFAISSIPK